MSYTHIKWTLHWIWCLLSYGISCHYGNFWEDFLWISEQILLWMMDEFIHWPKPYLSLISNLWCNIAMDDWNLDEKSPGKGHQLQHHKSITLPKIYKEWQIMLGQHLVLVTLHHGLQLVLSKTIRIADTKSCTSFSMEFSILDNLFYKSFKILNDLFLRISKNPRK